MGDDALFRAGEVVLLVDLRRGTRHLLTLRAGQAFHSDRGFIPHDSLVGLPEGTVAVATRGARYLALRPTLAEYVLEMPRGAQIIYPKDLATIALFDAKISHSSMPLIYVSALARDAPSALSTPARHGR